jgi:broad specificity phosphatase PhoE
MQLILIRHGQPDAAGPEPTVDPPLSPLGLAQAEHVAAVLRAEPISRIFSSGMARADLTAAPLAAATGLPVIRAAGLGEVDRGGRPYLGVDSIRDRGRREWSRFMAAPLAYYGVDPAEFRAETLVAFDEILQQQGGGTAAIFTHGFPINILLSHVLGLAHDARFVPFHASFTRLSGRSLEQLTVVSVNEHGHIPAGLR